MKTISDTNYGIDITFLNREDVAKFKRIVSKGKWGSVHHLDNNHVHFWASNREKFGGVITALKSKDIPHLRYSLI